MYKKITGTKGYEIDYENAARINEIYKLNILYPYKGILLHLQEMAKEAELFLEDRSIRPLISPDIIDLSNEDIVMCLCELYISMATIIKPNERTNYYESLIRLNDILVAIDSKLKTFEDSVEGLYKSAFEICISYRLLLTPLENDLWLFYFEKIGISLDFNLHGEEEPKK